MGLLGNLKSFLSNKVDIKARFEIDKEAISGTMSSFYLAHKRETRQVVGLKICNAEKLAQFESRFKGLKKPSEGEIGKAITHPNVVKTLDFGLTNKGEQYIVLEYLDGPGLNSLIIGKSKLLDGKRVTLLHQAAEAIAAVHKAGYIHRDICPRNFVVAPDGSSLKLIDFGLTVPATPDYMQPGNRTGTPNYMAPEVVRRKKTDQRLDVFSFGVTAFEMCTFRLPWERGTTGKAALEHDTLEAIDIRKLRPNINARLGQAIMKCLAPNVEDRLPSMDHFLRVTHSMKQEDGGI